ncbi:hypothetical protein B0H14DRAFT_2568897 [Mycena olivaceomarginata]|nr:hypothetical protein B0H14DRAFT_2568897 [Mycena olivaceomarginata]
MSGPEWTASGLIALLITLLTALIESTSLPLNADTKNDSIARRRRLVRRVLFVVVSPMKTQSPGTVKMLAKRERMVDVDGEVEDSVLFKRQNWVELKRVLGRKTSIHGPYDL